MCDRFPPRRRAAWLGKYPSSLAILRMRSATSAPTSNRLGPLVPRRTEETARRDTFARSAMSTSRTGFGSWVDTGKHQRIGHRLIPRGINYPRRHPEVNGNSERYFPDCRAFGLESVCWSPYGYPRGITRVGASHANTSAPWPAPYPSSSGNAAEPASQLVLVCRADNDVYRLLSSDPKQKPARYDAAGLAVEKAPKGAGLLILADGYPEKPTPVSDDVLKAAARKDLKLYIEFPASLPGTEIGKPKTAGWERAVVASDAFGEKLPRLQILAAHGCQFVPLKGQKADIVLARVAGVRPGRVRTAGTDLPAVARCSARRGLPACHSCDDEVQPNGDRPVRAVDRLAAGVA